MSEIWSKKVEAVEIFYEMEMHLPSQVFNIQFHDIFHIVEDIELAGPVSMRWMYFVERCLKVLKDYVRQHVRPEGSMAKGYFCVETMFFVNNYSLQLHQKAMRLRKPVEEDGKINALS